MAIALIYKMLKWGSHILYFLNSIRLNPTLFVVLSLWHKDVLYVSSWCFHRCIESNVNIIQKNSVLLFKRIISHPSINQFSVGNLRKYRIYAGFILMMDRYVPCLIQLYAKREGSILGCYFRLHFNFCWWFFHISGIGSGRTKYWFAAFKIYFDTKSCMTMTAYVINECFGIVGFDLIRYSGDDHGLIRSMLILEALFSC